MTELEQLSINALRFLAVDAVQKANSGHPGAPLGCAPIAYLLFHKYMRHNPKHSKWVNRDRFVLSNGHASMLLYSSLYLAGYPISLQDIENFRQVGSPTAGHPERHVDLGIEATTGPLDQGISMSVGIALGAHMLAARFNSDGHEIMDHYTFVIASDGIIVHGSVTLMAVMGVTWLILLAPGGIRPSDPVANALRPPRGEIRRARLQWVRIATGR